MGIILRQGAKHSLITLGATIIGMVNALFIYTAVLTEEEIGLYQYLLMWGKFLAPFLLLGLAATSIKFFSAFQEKSERNNGFLFFLLGIPFLSFCIFSLICWLTQDSIFENIMNHENAALLNKYLPYTIFLIFALMFSSILTAYISNFKRIVVPEIFNNLWLKIAVPMLAIAYYYEYISLTIFILGIVLAYLFSTFALFVYLWKLGELDLKPNKQYFDRPLLKEIKSFASFSLLGGVGTLIATQIDTLMVGSLINLKTAGVYTIALHISAVIGIPFRSVFSITAPIVAESFNQKDMVNVEKLYHKSSLNLLVLGILILVGIWASVDLLFEIIPNGDKYIAGKYVILFLGLAKIIDMATSINTHIIIYSKHFRYNLYFSLVLALLNIIFNLIFIPQFGLIGVAIATLTSMFLLNLMKVLFVWAKFKMQPFSVNMFWVLAVGGIAYGLTLLLPKTENPFIDIIINSLVITFVYVPTILYFNLSDDLTKIKQELIKKVKEFIA